MAEILARDVLDEGDLDEQMAALLFGFGQRLRVDDDARRGCHRWRRLRQHDGELHRYVATAAGVAVEPPGGSPDQFSAAVKLRDQRGIVFFRLPRDRTIPLFVYMRFLEAMPPRIQFD
jgi:hypothetical protein